MDNKSIRGNDFLRSFIRDVPDFPKPGIIFKDITPLLGNSAARKTVLELIVNDYKDLNIQAVAAIEARGFLFGMLLADALNVPFVPIRKMGKLPFRKMVEHYDLEYGTSVIEIHEDSIQPNTRVLIHDDLLATGGTAIAAGQLVRRLGGEIAGFSFIINLSFLNGSENLKSNFGVEARSVITF